jgi:rubredoxin
LDILRQSPESSVSSTLLLKLHKLTSDDKYMWAGLKAINAVIESVLGDSRWEDFETYWSCSTFGQDHLGKKFARNGQYKQCTFSMFWTAEALFWAWKSTREEAFLEKGRRVMDELSMYQAVWQPPYMNVNVFGGFAVMNADAEWLDARQSLFAELFIEYGYALNDQELIGRGMAALRASFAMMYCPENPAAKKQWEQRWGFFGPEDYGFMMENYGHKGYVLPDGTGMGVFSIFDWGAGAAAEAYNRILDHYGEALFKKKDFYRVQKDMTPRRCNLCGYVYMPAAGDPAAGISPGTSLEDVPDYWTCPVCGAGKDNFPKP